MMLEQQDIRQVIVMRKDLNMRAGKMIAQGAHASMKVLLDIADFQNNSFTIPLVEDFQLWLSGKFKKICVRVESETELLEIVEKAKQAGLPVALITDSGLTEFNGVATNTCCAIGPASKEKLDLITGHLRLL